MRNTKFDDRPSRRRRLLLKGVLCAPLVALPAGLAMAQPRARELRFEHLHTGETLGVTYWENGAYLPDALAEINVLMRDFRTDEVLPIAPGLLDFVHRLQITAGSSGTFQIISAYRSPATNAMLRESSNGVARKSRHMKGQALDIRYTAAPTATLRDIARNLSLGGVGHYPSADFLHIDVGPVRTW